MRVRVLRDFVIDKRILRVGEIVDIATIKVIRLLESGLVMQDKSLDGGKEIKAHKQVRIIREQNLRR